MTAALNLHVGVLTRRLGTDEAVRRILREVVPPIVRASGRDIRLTVIDEGQVTVPGMQTEGPLVSETLHAALERMTGNQTDVSRITEIGLLVADRYEPSKGSFGMMFDKAFNPASSNRSQRKAREGCAVFLGGIEAARAPADVLDEVVFTAVHELAHVFNIQHGARPSYMFQSAAFGQVALADAAFSGTESWLLSKCSSNDHIFPGRSAFADLGDLVSLVRPGTPANAPPFDLRIGLQYSRFWNFEPVELDVELSTASVQPLSVPDGLDCGYGAFRIWIEEPDGEKRFLRSPRHYCSPRGTLAISADQPFRRDISIFGESGGYTFRKAGVHRVHATFEFDGRSTISSNVIELEILPQAPDDPFYVDAQATLAQSQVARLLYYRRLTPPRLAQMRKVAAFCEKYGRHPASAFAHYGAGRALARAAVERAGRGGNDIAALVSAAMHHLTSAARRKQLGDHRRRHVEEALFSLAPLR
jgi:hypothetical protein